MSYLQLLQEKYEPILEAEITKMFKPIEEPMKSILLYYHRLGGKRIRPALCMISSEMVGGTAEQAAPAAAICELIHTFSLFHDDVIDNAETRRGAETVHKKWDLATAIVAGDILHAVIHGHIAQSAADGNIPNDQALTLLKWLIYEVEVKSGFAAIEESRMAASDQIPSFEEALKVTEEKTSPIIEFAMKAGALLGGGNEEEIEKLRLFGQNLGIAFQLKDDLLDFIGTSNKEKDVGGDLREGKKTPLMVLINENHPEMVQKHLGKEFSKEDFEAFASKIGSEVTEIGSYMKKYVGKAIVSLEGLKDSEAKIILQKLASSMSERTK